MVKLDKIYTKGGDRGITSLVGGKRVGKDSDIIQTIGQVDEVNALLGVIACNLKSPNNILIKSIQNDLFDVGADLSTPIKIKRNALRINKSYTHNIEIEIDKINSKLMPLTSFILPGGGKISSLFHLARTATRRCEISIVKLSKKQKINMEILKFFNRLSDLFFVLARKFGKKENMWKPQKKLNKKGV